MKVTGVAKNFPVVCVGGSAGGLDAYIHSFYGQLVYGVGVCDGFMLFDLGKNYFGLSDFGRDDPASPDIVDAVNRSGTNINSQPAMVKYCSMS
jgi:hypothetical protein